MLYLSEIHVNEKITNGKTLEFLNIAAESKLYYAYFLLGRIYLFGNGTVRINEEKGWDYIEKAAQLGVKDAIQLLEVTNCNLPSHCEGNKGIHLTIDNTKAPKLYAYQ